ncbi:MAG: hypothetical protein Q8N85_06140 [Candidatus Omnitrophota bacterium]|nr:hypothetical protein [Candidatus Omnitrophota bacterium]
MVTSILTALVYLLTRSIPYAAAVILGGIFIDLDHLLDYFFCFGAGFKLGKFVDGDALASGHVYLFLHSWELVLVILLAGLTIPSGILLALFLGMSAHLTVDSIQRNNPFTTYLLFYRISKKFQVDVIMPAHHGYR